LEDNETATFRLVHPLVNHLYKMIQFYKDADPAKFDFSKLCEPAPRHASQKAIPSERVQLFTACLFHFDMNIGNVMRYVGDEYTGGYRNIQAAVEKMHSLGVDDDLISRYARLMLLGAPTHFVAESTRDNFLQYWRQGNNTSVAQYRDLVQKSMNKLDKNNYVMPFHSYVARFVPHIFLTPIHLLKRPGKDERVIYDASRRYNPLSVPINHMTSTQRGVELDCNYGQVLTRILERVWNLRISHPFRDIAIHANDVKSCFRQLKHHPDVMGAFSYIIEGVLFASCGLTMGSDFSPAVWEVCRRIIEQLAAALFDDKSLIAKHRERLNTLTWSKKLGKAKESDFVPAHATSVHKGVMGEDGQPINTPHHMFVDDDIYADVYCVDRIEQTIASGIEAVFIVLGESAINIRQDPIAWDKLAAMIIHFANVILGQLIDTRKMTIETPPDFISKVVTMLHTTWGPHRKSFTVREAEVLAGQLNHISNTAPWLKHIMAHLYKSIAAALGSNKASLVSTNRHFREQIQLAKANAIVEASPLEVSFAQSETARLPHHSTKKHWILPTMKAELDLIRQALSADWVDKSSPIAHLISDIMDGEAHGDSSLKAAGGFSTHMKFWWYHEWPTSVRHKTLLHIPDGQSGDLIDINCLEYATVLINYAACMYYWVTLQNIDAKRIPYPKVLIKADNVSSEVWTVKGCKHSNIGRRLGRLQCAMMINNPVMLDTGRVDTKTNVIADRISRWECEADTSSGFLNLLQDFPQLRDCQRFHPSQELISLIWDALLNDKLVNPLEVNHILQSFPGRIGS
jgi:hypothetical protein